MGHTWEGLDKHKTSWVTALVTVNLELLFFPAVNALRTSGPSTSSQVSLTRICTSVSAPLILLATSSDRRSPSKHPIREVVLGPSEPGTTSLERNRDRPKPLT
jgi:hypothetical protein